MTEPCRFLKATISYDGSDFCGWQVQAEGRTVQSVLESAWHRLTGEQRRITASGRTDAGVHALGQVVSWSTESNLTHETIGRALNANLPEDVRVRSVEVAPQGFHAIRDATGKRYRYWIQDGAIPSVFLRKYVWHLPKRLNDGNMRRAAEHLVGRHDFRAFQASGSDRKTTVRTVRCLKVDRQPDLLVIETEADGFLYNQVRNFVGSLILVGQGRRPPDWMAEVLMSRDRRQAGPTAPARGLCLVEVHYGAGSTPGKNS